MSIVTFTAKTTADALNTITVSELQISTNTNRTFSSIINGCNVKLVDLLDYCRTTTDQHVGVVCDTYTLVTDTIHYLASRKISAKHYELLTTFQQQFESIALVKPDHWHVTDYNAEINLASLTNLLKETGLAPQVDLTVFEDYTSNTRFNELEPTAEIVDIAQLLMQYIPPLFATSDACFDLRIMADTNLDPEPSETALDYSPVDMARATVDELGDSQFTCLIQRSIGNASLFQAINAIVTALEKGTDLDDLFHNNMNMYYEAVDYCEAHAETTYDKPMNLRDALTMLMTPRPPSEEMIERLSAAAHISIRTLMDIATLSAVERTTKFRKHRVAIAEAFETTFAKIAENRVTYNGSKASVQHFIAIRYMRACAKAKIATLNYTVKTSRLDRLGFFSYLDNTINKLNTIASDLEFDYPELMDTELFIASASDAMVEYKRLGA